MKIYFIGIGGASMSGIARLLAARGHRIAGCDRTATDLTETLIREGIPVAAGHEEDVAGNDLVVYTNGVPADNPQLLRAASLGIPIMERAELLGLISLEYDDVIAVAGTHGKTTTTAMIGLVLDGLDPTVHVGADASRIGGRKLFVTEACEYRNSFLSLKPDLSVILNVECDHPDFYRTPAALHASFAAFAARTRESGLVLVHESVRDRIGSPRAPVRTFGPCGDYAYGGALFDGAMPSFDFYANGEKLGRISLRAEGAHLITDALAAAAVGLARGIPWQTIVDRLALFRGVPRRWERVGTAEGCPVISDYAHHPTQIRGCIDTVRRRGERAVVIFQPHTYSRTRALFSEYVRALKDAAFAVVTDVYAARENSDGVTTGYRLARAVTDAGGQGHYARSFEEAAALARSQCGQGVSVLVLGAGDVTSVIPSLIDRN